MKYIVTGVFLYCGLILYGYVISPVNIKVANLYHVSIVGEDPAVKFAEWGWEEKIARKVFEDISTGRVLIGCSRGASRVVLSRYEAPHPKGYVTMYEDGASREFIQEVELRNSSWHTIPVEIKEICKK